MRRMADSIRDEIQRAVFDSLARLQAAASAGPRSGQVRTVDGRTDRVFVQRGRDGGRFIGLAPELDSMIRAAEALGALAVRVADALARGTLKAGDKNFTADGKTYEMR
mgnify:CR=1 FL=1